MVRKPGVVLQLDYEPALVSFNAHTDKSVGPADKEVGAVAKWKRPRPAKPCPAVRFSPAPPSFSAASARSMSVAGPFRDFLGKH